MSRNRSLIQHDYAVPLRAARRSRDGLLALIGYAIVGVYLVSYFLVGGSSCS